MLDSSPRVIDVQTRALELLDGDWSPVPIQRDTNIPEDGWAKLQLTEENVSDHFRDGCNIGAVLGKPSNGLTELHLSTEGACIAAELVAPVCRSRFRLEGAEYSTTLLYSTALAYGTDQPVTIVYRDPVDDETLVEIKIKETFTVLPPSVIEGTPLQWDEARHEYEAMPETPDAALIEAAKLIAAVALLAKHWPAPNLDVAAKIKAAEEAETEVEAADRVCTRLAAEPARALALAMAKDATDYQKATAQAAYEAVRADMAIADAAHAAAQQRAADTAEKARVAKATADTKLAMDVGGFLDCAGILPQDARRALRCLAQLTGNRPDAFDHCVDGGGRHTHDQPGLMPALGIGLFISHPVCGQMKEWFCYDSTRERGKPSDIPRTVNDSSKLTYYADCETVAAKNWILKDLLAKGEASSWIGPPGTGKSAVLTEIAVRAAGGIDFRNFRSKGACGVVHLAFERATHTRRRMTAYTMRGFKGLPIAIRSGIINLMEPGCVALIIQVMEEAGVHLGTPIGLVVIDTFAKGLALGGGDENTAKDSGKALGHLNAVREATGCHTAIIHHTGKDTSKGARGSNALVGDTDVEFTISGDKVKVVTVTKANDQPEGECFRFSFVSEEIGRDDDGDPITVGILADQEVGSLLSEARDWPGKVVRLRDSINDVILDGRGFDYAIPRGPTVRAVHLEDLRALYRQKVVDVNSDPKRPNKAADNALQTDIKRAAELHLIGTTNILHKGVVWAV